MEKIQDAIAKARAARAGQTEGDTTPPATGTGKAKPGAPADTGASDRATGQAAPDDTTGHTARDRSAARSAPDRSADHAAPDMAAVHAAPDMAAVHAAPDMAAVHAAWASLTAFEPAPARLTRNRILTYSGGTEATDFDVLRTRILQQMRVNKWRRLAITSPDSGCGKSTLALNLAFSLSRLRDQRTVLCEMDMRRPTLARTLGLRSAQNFDAVLRETADFADHAVRIGDALAIATNERAVRGAAELLQSASTGRALDRIEADYAPTVMLFDLPPVQAGDDAMAFIGHVDCVVMIAAAEQTSLKQIDACERDIARQTNVMGVILNKCRYTDPDQAYGNYG